MIKLLIKTLIIINLENSLDPHMVSKYFPK